MNQQIVSLRNEITALRNEMIARLERVEGVLDARLKQVEEHSGCASSDGPASGRKFLNREGI
jgi:hypothetical protein